MEKPYFAADLLFQQRRRRNNCDVFQNDVRLFQNKNQYGFGTNQERNETTCFKPSRFTIVVVTGIISHRLSNSQLVPRSSWGRHDGCHETEFEEGWRYLCLKWHDTAGDPSRSEARRVGLGGHDDGASEVDEGVENAPFPVSKQERSSLLVCPTFSDFVWVENDFWSERWNCIDETLSSF